MYGRYCKARTTGNVHFASRSHLEDAACFTARYCHYILKCGGSHMLIVIIDVLSDSCKQFKLKSCRPSLWPNVIH